MDSGTQTLESMSEAEGYNKWLLNKFKTYLKGEILEIGSGVGNFTTLLKDFGDVTATDVNQEYILGLKKDNLTENIGFADIEKGRYYFKNKRFDVVVCLNVVEHIKDDGKALKNLHDLLKAKGNLILIVPSHQSLFGEVDSSIGHFRRYDKKKLIKVLEKLGFKILKQRRLNFLGAMGWFVAGKLLKQKTIKKGNVKIFNIISPLFLFLERFFEPPLGTSVFIVARRSK